MIISTHTTNTAWGSFWGGGVAFCVHASQILRVDRVCAKRYVFQSATARRGGPHLDPPSPLLVACAGSGKCARFWGNRYLETLCLSALIATLFCPQTLGKFMSLSQRQEIGQLFTTQPLHCLEVSLIAHTGTRLAENQGGGWARLTPLPALVGTTLSRRSPDCTQDWKDRNVFSSLILFFLLKFFMTAIAVAFPIPGARCRRSVLASNPDRERLVAANPSVKPLGVVRHSGCIFPRFRHWSRSRKTGRGTHESVVSRRVLRRVRCCPFVASGASRMYTLSHDGLAGRFATASSILGTQRTAAGPVQTTWCQGKCGRSRCAEQSRFGCN